MTSFNFTEPGIIDPEKILLIVLIILSVFLVGLVFSQRSRIRKLEKRCDRFMRGSDGLSLEKDIENMFHNQRKLAEEYARNRTDIDDLYSKIEFAIQHVGIVKYDAFRQMGGNLSYAAAFLDSNFDGLIINAVQSVDGSYSYVKIVKGGRAEGALSKEEQNALNQALGVPETRE